MPRAAIKVLPEGDDPLVLMTVANDGTRTATNDHYHVQITYL